MRADSSSFLDRWYAELFGIDLDAVWQRFTARNHSKLGEYEGYFVAWRDNGVHISLPTGVDSGVAGSLADEAIDTLRTRGFWQEFAAARGLKIIGPSIYTYLDIDPGSVEGIVAVDDSELASLQAQVDPEEWVESGWPDQPEHTFGLYTDGSLVAGSNLTHFDGKPCDIGVLVARAWRGRGLSKAVGQHAASHAIREYGLARWRAEDTNLASLAAARRLGFESWCTQLAIR